MATSTLVRLRRAWPVAAVSLALGLSVAATPAESASGNTLSPTVAAARAGVQRGNAYMGWKNAASPATLRFATRAAATGVNGIDVSRWQGNVNWSYWKAHGKSFAYVKATEGTGYRNAYFSQQYGGSYAVGMIRGAYHYALPSSSSGSAQASYFVAHGGGWSRDGRTLPGVLDIEYNPYGATCYGLSKSAMVSWVRSFTARYKQLTKRDAVIYTNLDWWTRCTGNSTAFRTTNPLWVARYASKVGTLPGGWPYYTFWQYGTSPLDQDRFSSTRSRLVALANG